REALPALHAGRKVLVEPILQPGLVVPGVELGRPAVHVQVNDGLGLRREMRQTRQGGMNRSSRRRRGRAEPIMPGETGEAERSQANAAASKKLTTREEEIVLVEGTAHGNSCWRSHFSPSRGQKPNRFGPPLRRSC